MLKILEDNILDLIKIQTLKAQHSAEDIRKISDVVDNNEGYIALLEIIENILINQSKLYECFIENNVIHKNV